MSTLHSKIRSNKNNVIFSFYKLILLVVNCKTLLIVVCTIILKNVEWNCVLLACLGNNVAFLLFDDGEPTRYASRKIIQYYVNNTNPFAPLCREVNFDGSHACDIPTTAFSYPEIVTMVVERLTVLLSCHLHIYPFDSYPCIKSKSFLTGFTLLIKKFSFHKQPKIMPHNIRE